MKKFRISNIQWDTDGEDVNLPTELTVELEIGEDEDEDEVISDWLSDTYGWCHYGFEFEEV